MLKLLKRILSNRPTDQLRTCLIF